MKTKPIKLWKLHLYVNYKFYFHILNVKHFKKYFFDNNQDKKHDIKDDICKRLKICIGLEFNYIICKLIGESSKWITIRYNELLQILSSVSTIPDFFNWIHYTKFQCRARHKFLYTKMHFILYSYITTLFIPSYLPLLSFCCVLTHSTSWTVRNIQSLHLYVFSTGCATTRVVFYPLLLLTPGQRFMGILFLKQISKPVYCLCCSLIYSIRCGMLFD